MGQSSSDVRGTEVPTSSPIAGSRQRRRRKKSELSRALASNGERIAVSLQTALVLGSAQALGAVHLVTLLVAAALGLSACVLCYRARLTPRWKAPAPALVLLALAAFTLAQAVPLPAAFVAKVAPAAAEIWAGSLSPFKLGGPS